MGRKLWGDEAALVAAAEARLGTEVLAAGVFSWQELVKGEIAGQMAGGIAGDDVGDLVGGAGGVVGGAVGTMVGGRAGVEAMAAAHGMTPALVVAVTAEDIVVCNLRGEDVGEEVRRFPRDRTHVSISKLGLSRIVVLEDPEGEVEARSRISLHSTVAPYLAQHGPDKVVLHLLAEPG